MLFRSSLSAVSAFLLLTASDAVAEEWTQRAKLIGSDTVSGDGFGRSVAISGDTAIVGARGERGSAYLFGRDVGGVNNWGELIKLTPSDTAAGVSFGDDVAISGDLAIVGARTGAAYLFERDHGGPNNWGEVVKLTVAESDQGFGSSVALSGEIAMVGAISGNDSAGAAYVFERHSGGANNWGEVAKTIASDAATGDRFHAVALSDDTAVVGAWAKNARAGAAYVFGRDENGENDWGETVKLTASDAADSDRFGRSNAVGISGDTAIIGAFGNDDVGVRSGSAYLFDRDKGGENTWGEVIKITASDAGDRDEFGWAVAISEERAIVGAWHDENAVGAAYVFGRDQGGLDNWGEVAKLTATDTAVFGIDVDISGDTAIVGACCTNDVGEYFSAAYVFSTNGPPELVSDLTNNGFVDFQDLTILLANWNKEVTAAEGNLVDAETSSVNFQDLTVLLADWTGPGPAGSPEAALGEAVPEPSSLLLLAMATLGLSCGWRRRRRA